MDIRIGICSNIKTDIDDISRIFKDVFYGNIDSLSIDVFSSIKELDDASLSAYYDVIFADLDMPDIDGIELISHIAKVYPMVDMIIFTSHNELVFETIRFRPFRFIRKEYMEKELYEAALAIVDKISDKTVLYELEHKGSSAKVKLLDVDYIECEGHYLNVHAGERGIQIRGKISEYEEKLSSYGFVRVHRGYLANLRSIDNISSKEILLKTGETLPISRKKVDLIKMQYDSYIKRFVRGIN